MRTVTRLHGAHVPKVTATEEDGAVVLRVEAVTVLPPDELVPFPFNLERSAASRAIRDGHLKAARIGRRLYARRSEILALVDRFAVDPKAIDNVADSTASYAAIVAESRKRK